MYGFHKVPHLNDGTLHTENTPEIWEFTNEYFTRDNPDFVRIIKRKIEAEKARSAKRQRSPEPQHGPATGFPAIEAPPNVTSNVNIALVYEEICNIKRLQGSVVGELKRLKKDSDALWTEAAEARARYDQQQTTINKMLKFLSSVFGTNKSNSGSLPSRNRGLLTGPPAFEELGDDPVVSVLTPEAQETGAREYSNLFGDSQPILPINAGDAAWWQNLVNNGSENGIFNIPAPPTHPPPNDEIITYEPLSAAFNQHHNSLAAMELAVNQTDQSIGRISDVMGINNWDNYNWGNPDGLSFDPVVNTDTQPEYRFEDFIRSNFALSTTSNDRHG